MCEANVIHPPCFCNCQWNSVLKKYHQHCGRSINIITKSSTCEYCHHMQKQKKSFLIAHIVTGNLRKALQNICWWIKKVQELSLNMPSSITLLWKECLLLQSSSTTKTRLILRNAKSSSQLLQLFQCECYSLDRNGGFIPVGSELFRGKGRVEHVFVSGIASEKRERRLVFTS